MTPDHVVWQYSASALLASPYLVRLVPVLLCTCWSCHARSCCRVCVGLDTGRPCASRGCHGRLRGSCASCSRHCCLPLGTVVWTRPSPVTALHPQHLGVLCTCWSMQRLQPQLPFVRPSRCSLRSVAVSSVSASGVSALCVQRCRIEDSSVRIAYRPSALIKSALMMERVGAERAGVGHGGAEHVWC